ncbi:ParB/RepB/Spo0J family partition protein [Conyzicola sp.]|uniref:ParB/RepB/Spo0J family partition protein n=1 Tax=Conyzicola sp. TaxID=1969404 RepID=UPI003988CD85
MTSTPGHIELERSIDSIRIGARHRTDLGDIEALAASIEQKGLLQPITVTPDGILICGARRVAALRQLGVRKINVWVRSGLSDRLTQLLAEQDDNALHKPLSPAEAATLYREVKALLAEDARRRQEASRFGSDKAESHSYGAATVAAPVTSIDGYTRAQAALLVTGRRSYTTLERISDLQRLADNEGGDDTLRRQALAELHAIQNGGSVASAHRRVTAKVTEMARVPQTEFERESPERELGQLAKEALDRNSGARTKNTRAGQLNDTKLPVRSFVFQWNDLHDWWEKYDYAEVASQLTDEQWEQFEAAVAGTIAFAERMRAFRDEAGRASETTALNSAAQ